MSISVFILGLLLGAFIVPAVLADPQSAVETGKEVVSGVQQIVEMVR